MKKWNDGAIGELVLYKNNQLLALQKPAGLPTQSDQSGDTSLVQLAERYAKHPLQLIHRIDRPASGVVLFAKNTKALALLNAQFREREVQKEYLAVVGQAPKAVSGELRHFLSKKGRSNKSIVSTADDAEAREAYLEYERVDEIDNYSLLRITLHSGRHHQIRAQLAAIDAPIKGDVKYGFRRKNKDRSIHLHAWRLRFRHPVSGEAVLVEAPLPDEVVWHAFTWPKNQQS